MKNVLSASSLSSLDSDYNGSNSSRRMPVCELDFESRIMFNAKLPKKKPISEQLRKNDFVVDINQYKYLNSQVSCNNKNTQKVKSFKNCFNDNDNDDDDDEKRESRSIDYEDLSRKKASIYTKSNPIVFKIDDCNYNSNVERSVVDMNESKSNNISSSISFNCEKNKSNSLNKDDGFDCRENTCNHLLNEAHSKLNCNYCSRGRSTQCCNSLDLANKLNDDCLNNEQINQNKDFFNFLLAESNEEELEENFANDLLVGSEDGFKNNNNYNNNNNKKEKNNVIDTSNNYTNLESEKFQTANSAINCINFNSANQNDQSDVYECLLEKQSRPFHMRRTTAFVNSNTKNILSKPPLHVNSNSLPYNSNKTRNYKYRIWQCKIYNYLERPRGWKSVLYHMLM